MSGSPFAAATARIAELKGSISATDAELETLAKRLESVKADSAALIADKEAQLANELAEDLAEMDQQLADDVDLSGRFQDATNKTVVSALIDKQDAGIREEEAEFRNRLMEIAERELKQREDELIAVQESIKSNLLRIDEESHSAGVQAAYVKHKETMASLKN